MSTQFMLKKTGLFVAMAIAAVVSFAIAPVQAQTSAVKVNQSTVADNKEPVLLSASCLQGSIEISHGSTIFSHEDEFIRASTPVLTGDFTLTEWQVSGISLIDEFLSFIADGSCAQAAK
jgi:hypothetical protein